MIIEMRTHRTKPGKRAEFLDIFCSRSVPAQAAIGIRILGPFLSLEDPDVLFFMRGFPDLESRDAMKETFYGGPVWKQELEPLLLPLLESWQVIVIDDSANQIRFQVPS
jgi:hypothetical protein